MFAQGHLWASMEGAARHADRHADDASGQNSQGCSSYFGIFNVFLEPFILIISYNHDYC